MIIQDIKIPDNGLIDFYADWCAPCKMMEPIMDKLRIEGVKVLKVNVDEQPELSEYFGIRSIPTFVSIKDGKEHNRLLGANPESKLREIL